MQVIATSASVNGEKTTVKGVFELDGNFTEVQVCASACFALKWPTTFNLESIHTYSKLAHVCLELPDQQLQDKFCT